MEDGKKAGFTSVGAAAKEDGAKRCDFSKKEWRYTGARQAWVAAWPVSLASALSIWLPIFIW